MLEDYISDLTRKAIELRDKKVEGACKEYCVLNSIDMNDFIREATIIHRKELEHDIILVQYNNKIIISFKCDKYGGMTIQEDNQEVAYINHGAYSMQSAIDSNYENNSISINKAQELIDWIGKNKLKINTTNIMYDYVFCDELITKIKELFKV